MVSIHLISTHEFVRARAADSAGDDALHLLADMSRVNTLSIVKRAGSGHLGSSFSAMDIVTWLYYRELNVLTAGLASPDRDIYFSSKGHDVPGLYATLYALGVLPEKKLLRLRRLGGLDGHPDIKIPGIEANSGSLGMGISKGRGMAWAKKRSGHAGRVYVLTGDGEWQEGQNYEALQAAVHQGIDNLTVIVDHNKVQSDRLVSEILSLGDFEAKLAGFGVHVARIDGHNFSQIQSSIDEAKEVEGVPQVIIADTIKGRGVSFMEHPVALADGGGLYPWHSGAPDDVSYEAGLAELLESVAASAVKLGLGVPQTKIVEAEANAPTPAMLAGEPLSQAALANLGGKVSDEYVSREYGKALVELALTRKDLVVLDADLASDCKVRDFEVAYPERFIENGIAEQDMVSMAGGLARMGYLPVVNSFASFLASRANEQIYNNASERTRIIYALHYAGLIPAGPGKSHQSLRDISVLAAVPDCAILQPCNGQETRMVLDYCVNAASESCLIRLIIGPSPRRIVLPDGYRLMAGRGVELTRGEDALMVAYGPVMLNEALLASELLAERGFGLKVVNMPWLNRFDLPWLQQTLDASQLVFVLEDHAPEGGLGERLLAQLARVAPRNHADQRFIVCGVEGWPACGTPQEVLRFHRLDGMSLAERVLEASDR